MCFVLCFFTNSIFKTMELYVIIFMLQNYYYFYVYYSFLLQSSSSSLLPTLLIDERSTALMPTAENSYRKDFFFCFLLRQLSFSNMVKVSALFSSVAFTILTFPEKKTISQYSEIIAMIFCCCGLCHLLNIPLKSRCINSVNSIKMT